MKPSLAVVIVALLATPALAADAGPAPDTAGGSYSIDPRHTFPMFEINHLGFSTQRGRFDKTSGKVVLDPAKQQGSIEVNIDTTSIDMGFEDWNKHMRGPDYFNTDKFPTMSFKSDKLSFDAEHNPIAAEGELTLLGVSKPVTLKISGFKCGADPVTKKWKCGADVAADIKRSDFGLTKYVPYIGDAVRIMIGVEATKTP